MKVRAIRGLGAWALGAGLAALGFAPVQAQYGSDEATGLSYGLRGGLIFPLTDLDGSAGPAGSLFLRYGLMPKLQFELTAFYSILKTEDQFNPDRQTTSFRTFDFESELSSFDGRLIYSPISHDRWNPFVYGGFGYMHYKYDPFTIRRGNEGTVGWFGTVPVGLGTQFRLGDRAALEFSLDYTYTLFDQVDESNYTRRKGQVGVDANGTPIVGQLPGFDAATGERLPDNIIFQDGNDAFWGLSVGLVFGDIGYKPAIQERATPLPMPTIKVPEIEHLPELDPEPAPRSLPDPPTLDRDRVFFASNIGAPITEESKERLAEVISVMQENPRLLLDLHGYADDTGPRSYNLKLSQRRAEVVKKYLVERGIAAWRLSVKAFGEASPVSDNKTEEGRAMNRRVELVPLW